MYSRDANQKNAAVRPPNNYSGIAFLGGTPLSQESGPPGSLGDDSRKAQEAANKASRHTADTAERSRGKTAVSPPDKPFFDIGGTDRRANSITNEPDAPRDNIQTSARGMWSDEWGDRDGDEIQDGEHRSHGENHDREENSDCAECADVSCAVGANTHKHKENKNPLKGIFSAIMPPGIGKSGKDGEFGFEELMLVGLIFLLSQSEGDSDILLLLALLLFYK